jgi:two-component system sensor kinase FixL
MKSSRVSAYLLCGALMAAIFVLDALTPLGVAAGVPYVAVVLLALRLPRASVVLFAAVATVLTALGFWKTSGTIAEGGSS